MKKAMGGIVKVSFPAETLVFYSSVAHTENLEFLNAVMSHHYYGQLQVGEQDATRGKKTKKHITLTIQ
jgi:hypothetical protein